MKGQWTSVRTPPSGSKQQLLPLLLQLQPWVLVLLASSSSSSTKGS
jgi:hypothetical protein